MRVDVIELESFTNHKRTRVVLPPKGVLLITGGNGAGKSSLLEGVAWGCWGRTIRGTSPVRLDPGVRCRATITGDVRVERTRKGGAKDRATVVWSPVEGAAQEDAATTTKGQEGLERLIGDFDRWRRTEVFTSADAWGFGNATDAERKRLLEQLLGLEQFDTALERCRADLAGVRRAQGTLSMKAAEARVRRDEAARTVTALEAAAPVPVADLAEQTAKVERLARLVGEAARDLEALVAKERTAQGVRDRVAAAVAARDRAMAALRSHAECPTCAQPVTPDVVAALGKAARWLVPSPAEPLDDPELEAALVEAREEHQRLSAMHAETLAALRAHKAHAEQAQRHATTLAAARRTASENATAAGELESQVTAGLRKVQLLEHVEQVLGLRGLRATVLDGALRALQSIANVWLARFGLAGLTVALSIQADKVLLVVEGAGGGYGYDAASIGERKRIALALMMALAELAQGAAGGVRGTLWFDEVFDGLDDEGVAAVAAALGEMAADRCVAVITQSGAVLQHFPGARWLHVEGGAVRWMDEEWTGQQVIR